MKMAMARIFTILIVCFSMLNFQLGNFSSMQFGITSVYAADDDSTSGSSSIDLKDPSKIPAYLSFITMIAIGYYGYSLYKSCNPQAKDTMVAAVAAGIFIINEINTYKAYKDLEEEIKVSYEESDPTDSQKNSIEALKKNYKNAKDILEKKLKFQMVATAAFAGAATMAFMMGKNSTMEVEKCEAQIVDTQLAAKECVATYATSNPTLSAKCASLQTYLTKCSASIEKYKSNMFVSKSTPSMISAKEGLLILKASRGDQKALAAVSGTVADVRVKASEKKMRAICEKWMFSEEGGRIQQCQPSLSNLNLPSIKKGAMMGEMDEIENGNELFASIFDLFIPSASAGLMDASSLLGIGAAGMVLLVVYGKTQEAKFDTKMVHPKHRGWIWTGFGAAVVANIYFTKELINDVDDNIDSLDEILNKWQVLGVSNGKFVDEEEEILLDAGLSPAEIKGLSASTVTMLKKACEPVEELNSCEKLVEYVAYIKADYSSYGTLPDVENAYLTAADEKILKKLGMSDDQIKGLSKETIDRLKSLTESNDILVNDSALQIEVAIILRNYDKYGTLPTTAGNYGGNHPELTDNEEALLYTYGLSYDQISKLGASSRELQCICAGGVYDSGTEKCMNGDEEIEVMDITTCSSENKLKVKERALEIKESMEGVTPTATPTPTTLNLRDSMNKFKVKMAKLFNPFLMDAFAAKVGGRMGHAPCILTGKTKGRCLSAISVFKKRGVGTKFGPGMRSAMGLIAGIADGLQGKNGYGKGTLSKVNQLERYRDQMVKMNKKMVEKVNRMKRMSGKRVIGFEAYQKRFVDNIIGGARKAMRKSGISEEKLLESMSGTGSLSKIKKRQKRIAKSLPSMKAVLISGIAKNKKKQLEMALKGHAPTLADRMKKIVSDDSGLVLDATIHKNKDVSIFKVISHRYFKRMRPMMKRR